jgi:hypothetical protein
MLEWAAVGIVPRSIQQLFGLSTAYLSECCVNHSRKEQHRLNSGCLAWMAAMC